MPEMAQIFTEETCMPNRRIRFNVDLLGPYWSNVLAIFWLFLPYLCFQMPEMAQIFTEGSCMANRGILGHVNAMYNWNDHVRTILGS